jgi:hypothetical protein
MHEFNENEGAGGAGGEFFFTTSDGAFFIKTLKESEKRFYLDKLDQFTNHYKVNEDSLIV